VDERLPACDEPDGDDVAMRSQPALQLGGRIAGHEQAMLPKRREADLVRGLRARHGTSVALRAAPAQGAMRRGDAAAATLPR
jgi:hypothetical protein